MKFVMKPFLKPVSNCPKIALASKYKIVMCLFKRGVDAGITQGDRCSLQPIALLNSNSCQCTVLHTETHIHAP